MIKPETAGWVVCMTLPALVKLPSLATIANAFNCHKVIGDLYAWLRDIRLRYSPVGIKKSRARPSISIMPLADKPNDKKNICFCLLAKGIL
jgi:hypothetical protein